jgi:hypothetical protein
MPHHQVTERTVMKPIKLDVENQPHPMVQNPDLPSGMFLGAFIAPRGEGKTHLACQLIKRMEEAGFRDPAYDFRKVPLRTILVSPTADANPVFKSLTTLDPGDILHDFSFKKWEAVWDDVKFQKSSAETYMKEKDIHDRKKAGQTLSMREEAIIRHLHGEHPEPQGKYHIPPVTAIVFDDLANSPAFKLGHNNSVVNAAIRNRHNRAIMIMAVQHAKSIPRVLRNNLSLLAVGKFQDSAYATEDLYEMVSAFLSKEQFVNLYDAATAKKHGFLCVDCDTKRTTRNFEQELTLNESASSLADSERL